MFCTIYNIFFPFQSQSIKCISSGSLLKNNAIVNAVFSVIKMFAAWTKILDLVWAVFENGSMTKDVEIAKNSLLEAAKETEIDLVHKKNANLFVFC